MFIFDNLKSGTMLQCVKKISRYQLKGMTLIELLLVLALIGILLSMAVPKLMPLIGRTKSLEAQMQLKHVLNLEKIIFTLIPNIPTAWKIWDLNNQNSLLKMVKPITKLRL